MKFLFSVLVVILFIAPSFAQSAVANAAKKSTIEKVYEDIDIAKAKKIMSNSKNYVLIDVRTPGEIANGKIGDALEMDIKSPDFKSKLSKLDKDKQYIVYCHVGGRSTNAMKIMKDMGFKQVYNLMPGYKGWTKK
ncbi:MAG TPA: rhodanese-like domain-containing protein [Saprospiraceae bacterium]|nr:rhodanese-like domain-containing protein [Saprospiraceae bacterium]HMU02594.1 rhodanese-like domain-containing protein [Saprospiraceae bacterium]